MNERLEVGDYVRYVGVGNPYGGVDKGDTGWIRQVGEMNGDAMAVITMEKDDVADVVKKSGFCAMRRSIEVIDGAADKGLTEIRAKAAWGLA